MEQIIKQTRELGTSAGVLLPRSWLNKQVVVTLHQPSIKEISKEVMNYLIDQNLNEDIVGVYLHGSYARGEQDEESDIDIVVITQKTSKLIKFNNYDLLMVRKEVFLKNLPKSLHYQSMIVEAKPIINKIFLEEMRDKKIKLNYKENLREIKGMIKTNKESVEFYKENGLLIPDGVMYSIVLRLRELCLIKSIIKNELYSKINFVKEVGEEAYESYSRAKNDKKKEDSVKPEKGLELIKLSKKWLTELKD